MAASAKTAPVVTRGDLPAPLDLSQTAVVVSSQEVRQSLRLMLHNSSDAYRLLLTSAPLTGSA